MIKVIESLAIIFALILMQCATTLAETRCDRVCIFRQIVPFANCDPSSIELPQKDKIGVVGRVVEIKTVSPSCNVRVSIEVLRASIETMPQRIDIDIDNCMRWDSSTNDIINVQVLALADPRTGSYSLASCRF